jgi:hypothetical protein
MYRKIHIISLILLTAILIIGPGCSSKLSAAEIEIRDLKLEIAGLQEKIDTHDEEISEHDILTGNLNKLLSIVYYASAVPETEGREKNFTAFSMYYREEFYLITAGHCIEYDGIRYTDFKFKSNDSEQWIYPKLLYHEADYENNRDFAIFTYSHLRNGLMIEDKDMEPEYVLGNFERKLNFFKEFSSAKEGESGSPVLSKGCKLVGIIIKNNSDYTPISKVTEAIDSILEDGDI